MIASGSTSIARRVNGCSCMNRSPAMNTSWTLCLDIIDPGDRLAERGDESLSLADRHRLDQLLAPTEAPIHRHARGGGAMRDRVDRQFTQPT